ncbi:hypothetical protein ccbrp13_43890 [Ktedonobacteria bacterium brp13]|nr:hypothetical protein ccbrp13_43890 [Ktedonobacteria bacterium brp13]
MTSGVPGAYALIMDNAGFSEGFSDATSDSNPFTIPENTSTTNVVVSACVSHVGTVGAVTLQILDATESPVDGRPLYHEHEPNITINVTPHATATVGNVTANATGNGGDVSNSGNATSTNTNNLKNINKLRLSSRSKSYHSYKGNN